MTPLEDSIRREALRKFLEADEEGALDLLRVAHEMASPFRTAPTVSLHHPSTHLGVKGVSRLSAESLRCRRA